MLFSERICPLLTVAGEHPKDSLELFDRLGIYSAIFTDPTVKDSPALDTKKWHVAYSCLDILQRNETPGSIYHSLVRSDDARYIAWLLAALTPWTAIPLPVVKPGAKLLPPLGVNSARVGLRAETKVCNVLTGAFRHLEEITALKDAVKNREGYISQRDVLGMKIRNWEAMGGQWRLQALFALLVEAMNTRDESSKWQYPLMTIECAHTYADLEPLFGEWQGFIEHLESMQLMDAHSIKSIIDGKQLCKELGGLKPGIWTGEALKVCMEWQLRNPEAEDYAEAVEEVKRRAIELKIPLKS